MNQFYQKDDVNRTPITIVDDKESFYKLSDGHMIKKDVFPKYYMPIINDPFPTNQNTDVIDPNSFFNTSHIVSVEKIKSIDTTKLSDDEQEPSIVKNTTNQITSTRTTYNQNDSLVKPAPSNQPIPNNTNTDVSQYKVFDNDDDAYNDFIQKSHEQHKPIINQQKVDNEKALYDINLLFDDEKMAYGVEEAIKRKETRLKKLNINTNIPNNIPNNNVNIQNNQYSIQKELDPSEIMFKTFKRNHDISINLTIKDKIGKPEFVRMMMENIEGDIIKYYKTLIMNNIMNNIKYIEDEVEKNLKYEIFGIIDEGPKQKTNRKPRKPRKLKEQITLESKDKEIMKNDESNNSNEQLNNKNTLEKK